MTAARSAPATAMTFQGCRLPPDGAQRATSRISRTSSCASGCGRNFRVEIRRLSASVTVNMDTPVLSACVRTVTMNEIAVKLHYMRYNTAPWRAAVNACRGILRGSRPLAVETGRRRNVGTDVSTGCPPVLSDLSLRQSSLWNDLQHGQDDRRFVRQGPRGSEGTCGNLAPNAGR